MTEPCWQWMGEVWKDPQVKSYFLARQQQGLNIPVALLLIYLTKQGYQVEKDWFSHVEPRIRFWQENILMPLRNARQLSQGEDKTTIQTLLLQAEQHLITQLIRALPPLSPSPLSPPSLLGHNLSWVGLSAAELPPL